ncbi:PTS sugar transporter subunit IIC, partial [Escherichia coli]|uniref:PTS sugar transporter subunit IIC n=4 Tax=Escherichia coli TaxID=562 RepID=UPI001FA9B66E
MHEITLLQGLSLAALVFVLGIDFWLEALFLFRPIIVCTLTGAILGDIQTGLITGGLTELAFAGLTPAGGVQPPNPIMAGLMTTVIAWSTGVDAKTAIGLGLPFSLLMQYVIVDSIGQRNSYVKTWGCGGFLNETNIYSRGKSL